MLGDNKIFEDIIDTIGFYVCSKKRFCVCHINCCHEWKMHEFFATHFSQESRQKCSYFFFFQACKDQRCPVTNVWRDNSFIENTEAMSEQVNLKMRIVALSFVFIIGLLQVYIALYYIIFLTYEP